MGHKHIAVHNQEMNCLWKQHHSMAPSLAWPAMWYTATVGIILYHFLIKLVRD
jgi:hypothetical protein